MKKTSEIHIRLSQDNANKVLRLSRKHNMSYSAVANQLLDQVDVSNITVETKVETKTETVVIKKIIL
jgi:hypothetical protein